MRCKREKSIMGKGFTIVELLTVMGVIAILIGLLVPALNLVKDYSKEIQQRAQFHSLDVALEMYKTEFGSYPPSGENELDAPDPTLGVDSGYYGGANKLAEAMVGLDSLGFHPTSAFRADGQAVRDESVPPAVPNLQGFDVYHAATDDLPWGETADENVQARKGPFIDLENANAFEMQDVYDSADLGSFDVASLVLCDVFTAKRPHSSKKTGMPVLYYKARSGYTQQDSTDAGGTVDDIYRYSDNYYLLELGIPGETNMYHALADGVLGGGGTTSGAIDNANDLEDFDNMIRNEQVTAVRRPYRADSYILVSAGKDGVYGTPDDLFNFKKD